MPRSIKKGPFINHNLYRMVEESADSGSKKPIKTRGNTKKKIAKVSKQGQVRPTQMISSNFTKLDGFYGNRNKSLPLRLLGRNKRRGNYNNFTKIIMSRRRNCVKQNQQEHMLCQPQRPSSGHPAPKGSTASPRIQKYALRQRTRQTLKERKIKRFVACHCTAFYELSLKIYI